MFLQISPFCFRTSSLEDATKVYTAEVTGARLNRGAGYGLEIPCKYHLYGTAVYIERLETIIRGDEFED